jgi:predicted amidohydrolase YtcJ
MGALKVSCLPPTVDRVSVMKRRLADRAVSTPEGGWIVAEGYDDTRFLERRHPTRLDLDEAVPDHPALVTRVCGHMSVANTRALALAGVDRGTPDPPGGSIVRDGAGVPTGLLLERAQDLVLKIVPPADRSAIARALMQVASVLTGHGVTTICEALLGAFHPLEPAIWSEALTHGWNGPNVAFLGSSQVVGNSSISELPIIGTKLFADGVVTGRTAAVSQPFEGGGRETGMMIHDPHVLQDLVEQSVARALPVGIHAMGDRAIAAAVTAIERAEHCLPRPRSAVHGNPPSLRHRIEHCTLPTSSSLRRMSALGAVPVPQPIFLFAEGEAYRTQLGDERSAYAYPLRTMIGLGLRPALSSDAPATSWEDPIDPWLGIRAAVTRRTWAGSSLGTDETISIEQAMASYTANGAFAMSMEDRTGSLHVGKRADLMVLPEDPLTTPMEELEALRPQLVLVGGRVAYGDIALT